MVAPPAGYSATRSARTAGCLRMTKRSTVNANPGVARCAGSVDLYSSAGASPWSGSMGRRTLLILMPAVCSPECTVRARATGFHTESVSSDKHNGPRVELVQAIGFPFRQGSYPAGLTPRHGIDRLLPNHYLDLGKWQPVRHWPKDPLAASCSTEDAIAEISMIVKRQIRAVVTTTPTYLMLTAGKDSWMLLCLRSGPGRSIGDGHGKSRRRDR